MALLGSKRQDIFCFLMVFGYISLIITGVEAAKKCKTGYFGDDCKSQCRCNGKKCDSTAAEVVCEKGCQIGWTGKACSIPKKDADVKYVCVNSPSEGYYAYIRIDTKGVMFRTIQPITEEGVAMPWCPATSVQQNEEDNSATIKISIKPKTKLRMQYGECAGKNMGKNKYRWFINIEESVGVVSRNDFDVQIDCDFDKADGMVVSDDAGLKRESSFRPNDIRRKMKKLTPEKEKVTLTIVNPSSGRGTSKAMKIGTPVALKFAFGTGSDKATGVLPFNCKVSSPDKHRITTFVDHRGCPIEGFPITGFYKASSKTIYSNPFPLFGVKEKEKVLFTCSYNICFGSDPCTPNCDDIFTTLEPTLETRGHTASSTMTTPNYYSFKKMELMAEPMSSGI